MIDMERLVPVQLFRQSNATVEEGEEEADYCYGLKRIFKNLVRSLSNAEQTDQGQGCKETVCLRKVLLFVLLFQPFSSHQDASRFVCFSADSYERIGIK
jgi:hypothetical protein